MDKYVSICKHIHIYACLCMCPTSVYMYMYVNMYAYLSTCIYTQRLRCCTIRNTTAAVRATAAAVGPRAVRGAWECVVMGRRGEGGVPNINRNRLLQYTKKT